MSEEIELVIDREDLALIGTKSAVERFLRESGLLAGFKNLDLGRLGGLAQAVDSIAGRVCMGRSESRLVDKK